MEPYGNHLYQYIIIRRFSWCYGPLINIVHSACINKYDSPGVCMVSQQLQKLHGNLHNQEY